MTFEELIGPLLDREGGFVDHKNDRGGATNHGITQRVLADWQSARAKPYRDVRSLTRAEAAEIYRALYWNAARCDDLPESVRDIHFDSAVNHGVRRAVILLQGAAGATQDGAIGEKTMHAVHAMDGGLLRMRYIALRYRFYGSIIQRDRSQLVFIAGWMARMAEFN